MSFYVYRHTSPNGKVYIGITSQAPERRWGADGRGYRSNRRFFNAIVKYGWDNFKHEVLFEGLTKQEACEKEIQLIDEHKSYQFKYGYNQSLGGEHGKLTDESKQKIAGKVRELWDDPEYRRHMSEAHKGQEVPKGFHLTEEQKENLRAKVKERCKDPAYRERLSASAKKRFEKCGKEMLSRNGKAVWENPETRRRIIASKMGNHNRAKRVLCVETGEVFPSTLAAAKSVGACREAIGQVCRHEREMSHGFHWRFADE